MKSIKKSKQTEVEVQFLHHKQINILDLIYIIRGVPVMIDSDLAMIYEVETKYLKRSVRANIRRFPEDFMFELTREEFDDLRCKKCTSNTRGGSRYLPFAFTQAGIGMLSGVLNSDISIDANIRIMRGFVTMRQIINNNMQLFQRITKIEHHQIETDQRIEEIFKKIDSNQPIQEGIFFDGQVFDAYHFVSDLIRKAQKSIVLIDNYIDDVVLDLLDKRKNGVSATIYTKKINRQLLSDISRHNAQYPEIVVNEFNRAHDRFLLIDDEVYHIGASIKDLGKKWFAFSLMHDFKASELMRMIQLLSNISVNKVSHSTADPAD